jgi:hypothetical protein
VDSVEGSVEVMTDLLFSSNLASSSEEDARLRITGHLRKTFVTEASSNLRQICYLALKDVNPFGAL